MKVSPEVKRIADKYCDENGGPPKKAESPIIGVDLAEAESRTVIWLDEFGGLSDLWGKYILHPSDGFLSPKEFESIWSSRPPKIHRRPGTEFVATLPSPKLPPTKPWLKFKPTPKNPKRGRK